MSDSPLPHKFIAKHTLGIPKSGIREFFDIVTTMKDVVSLGIGEPDFVTPWIIREQAVYGIEKGHTSYTSNLGRIQLRRLICEYLASDFGVSYHPEKECLVTVGVSEALDLAFRAILDPGDEVIYHEPCYVSYAAEIALAHGVPVPVQTTAEHNFVPQVADIERAITPRTKAILLNFPCNPTGAVLTQSDIDAIAKLAIKHDLLVLTDEIYAELTYIKRPPTIASLPGMKERTIFLHGFSKAFAMTGFRLGYACGPVEIIDAMMKIHQYSILCAPTAAQEAAEEALRRGKPEMERMRDEYMQRRNFICSRLNKMGLTCRVPDGTFYVYPSIVDTGKTSRDFAVELLKEQHVAVVPGGAFGASGEGHIRCAYSTSMAQLLVAMDRMEEFMKKIKQ